MKQAVRELYRLGDIEGSQAILDKLDKLYGTGGVIPHEGYKKPIKEFVQDVLYGEFEMQPEVVRSDVYATLERGFREGLLLDNPQVLEDAIRYARDLTTYFRDSRYNDFVTKFGDGRMRDVLGSLEESIPAVLSKILLDTSQPMLDRLVIYRKAPDDVRALIYDQVKPILEREWATGRLAKTGMSFEQAFPEPPGIEDVRRAQAEIAKRRAADQQKSDGDGAQRK